LIKYFEVIFSEAKENSAENEKNKLQVTVEVTQPNSKKSSKATFQLPIIGVSPLNII
jgi:hypothetical protein